MPLARCGSLPNTPTRPNHSSRIYFTTHMHAQDILQFWFVELSDKQRFAKNTALDTLMRERFGAVLLAATRGELFTWRTTPQGRLAEIVVLDQFSRNIYRDTAAAFAQDAQALTLAQELVASGQDYILEPLRRTFAYMPYMHSESPVIHAQAMALFAQTGMEGTLDFERRHKAIIDQFGRFPHRNAILGRVSTPQELEFLGQPGSSF
jgi:uncharacterized protein (DUF924 family)